MNREVLESQWSQIREILRDKFSNLTDEDIRQINGRYDQLVAKLQQKYGYSREEAEERIRSWNFDRFASNQGTRLARDDDRLKREDRKEEGVSLLKWILGLGIPLLLALYLFNQMSTDDRQTTTPTTTQQVTTESQSDRLISNGLRDQLLANRDIASDVRNIQITTNNGVVTISGTVPDAATRDAIINSANNYSGVRQVIDNLRVR